MAMKESGIAWIGEIPNEWEISKIKYICCEIGSGTTPDSGNALYYDGVYNWIQSGDLYNTDVITNTEKKITDLAISENKSLSFYESDFVVIAMYGASVGNVSYSRISGYTNQACCVLKTDINNNLLYLKYFLNSAKDDLLREAEGGTQPNINQIKIKNLNIVKPLVKEQKLIADFLDDKVGKIDNILVDLNKQVEILNAYKKSLITETVTKGLNPNAPMKDSGIDWIGEIPEHWGISKLKYVSDFVNGDRGTNYPSGEDLVDEGVIFITSNNIHGNKLDNSPEISKYITEEHYNLLGGAKLTIGDIVFCLRGSVGMCAINTTELKGTVASSLVDIKSRTADAHYVNYFLQSDISVCQTNVYTNGSCAANLSAENVSNYYFIEPQIDEQKIIARYLDEKCSKIDDLIADKTAQIEKMEKYKKSLIFEYVTGKKRVKEVV